MCVCVCPPHPYYWLPLRWEWASCVFFFGEEEKRTVHGVVVFSPHLLIIVVTSSFLVGVSNVQVCTSAMAELKKLVLCLSRGEVLLCVLNKMVTRILHINFPQWHISVVLGR